MLSSPSVGAGPNNCGGGAVPWPTESDGLPMDGPRSPSMDCHIDANGRARTERLFILSTTRCAEVAARCVCVVSACACGESVSLQTARGSPSRHSENRTPLHSLMLTSLSLIASSRHSLTDPVRRCVAAVCVCVVSACRMRWECVAGPWHRSDAEVADVLQRAELLEHRGGVPHAVRAHAWHNPR